MGTARLAIYLVGLLLVVGAVWVFLTQTDVGQSIPSGLALALILLLVGIGVMASAKSINDSRVSRRVVSDTAPVAGTRYVDRRYDTVETPATGETIVEERRFD